MKRYTNSRMIVLGLLAGVLLPGCGGGGGGGGGEGTNPKAADDLRRFGMAFHAMNDAERRGPAKPEELEKYSDPADKEAYANLRAGKYVFLWNVSLQDMLADGPSNLVLAYEKDAPTKGGQVLMGDGFAKHMTAEEFQKAPKAKPKGK
jgi:hypothetical protein